MADPQVAVTAEDVKKYISNDVIPDDLREIVDRIAEDTETMNLRLSEFRLLHSMKMFGIAVGGASFVLGIIFILVAIFLFFNYFGIYLSEQIRTVASSVSLVVGIVQLLAGILLIGK